MDSADAYVADELMAVLFFDKAIWSPIFPVENGRDRPNPKCQNGKAKSELWALD